jgi:hypothetical protein
MIFFLSIDYVYLPSFETGGEHLKMAKLFGPDDPLFLPVKMKAVDGVFKVVGLKRDAYKVENTL